MDSADIPFGPPSPDTPRQEQIPLVVPDEKPKGHAHLPNRCKATTKAGKPCGMPAMNKITEGYCLPHDPGVTKEIRAKLSAGFSIPRAHGMNPAIRRLRTPEEVMNYVEELINRWENGPGAVLTVETLDSLANLIRIQLSAIKEKANQKAGKKDKAPHAEWRDVG